MAVTIEKCMQAWTNSLQQMKVKADIVFFGDSLTFYGNYASAFPNKVICNLGLRGDTIQGMIDRVEQVHVLQPKLVFLMAGINDVCNQDLASFKKHYESLLETLQNRIPNATIMVQSILPVNNIDYSISCNNEQIMKCNSVIEGLSNSLKFQYIDLYSIYVDDVMNHGITKDGIHLSLQGYLKWYSVLRDMIFK